MLKPHSNKSFILNSGNRSTPDSHIISSDQPRDAQQAVTVLKDSSTIFVSRIAHFIDALLGMSLAADFPQYRLASRQYAAQIFAHTYHVYDLLKSSDKTTWWQKLLGAKSAYEADQQTVLQAYWWMQILLLREEGKLPAWEGIRIVRERVKS